MEKRLYFCDVCGKEIVKNEICQEISIESFTIGKKYFDDDFDALANGKDYITILVCNDCYDGAKIKGSMIISCYEARRDEFNKKRKEWEERRTKNE